ncbi:2-dehydropantoate 2-reductase [Candidatus Woesearchaeota archaeon]|nr:2-dehydropantoate 2-reductase [Candidatus Woesearchaeota archaeon]
MKIIILGAGAIGSLFGAKLSRLNDVALIARKEHADAIEENALILLTTKVHDSEKAVKSIKNLIRKDTIILCLQNGLYSENIAKRIAGKRCLVLRAITNFGAAFLNPGAVQYNNYSYTSIEKSPKSNEIADNFAKCGLNGHVSQNIKYDMWKKLVFNCALNPLTAILKIENKGICDERLNPLKKLIIDECVKVAEKDGIRFELDFLKILNDEFKLSNNISSMQQDLIKGKKTEIGFLNGAVAELGKKYKIWCPANEALAGIISHIGSQTKL